METKMQEEKVWKVLIADDEKKVCQLIRYLVPWEELHLSVAAVVYNGLEAIEVLKEQEIDIVITDARMPECDGIELVKWCHQQRLNLKYIVISGYRHFEYAHGALQYGVDAYLLKPINQQELIDSLKKLVDILKEERSTRESLLKIQSQHQRDRDKLRRHFISSYIFDGRKLLDRRIDSLEEINEVYQMGFTEGVFRAICIKVDNVENSSYKIDKLLERLRETAEEGLKGFGSEEVGVLIHSGILLFLNYPKESEPLLIQKVEELYQKLEKTLDIFEGLRMTIGISCQAGQIGEIHRCIVTAGDAVRYRILLPNQDIIWYDRHRYQQVPVEQIFTPERRELLQNQLRAGSMDGLRKLLFELRFSIKQYRNISPLTIYYILQETADAAMEVFEELVEQRADGFSMFATFAEKEDSAQEEESLWQALLELLDSCIEVIGRELVMQQTKPIRVIKEYVEEHFAESITLELVSEQVNLSANYVSAIFRKETGVTFSDYLTAKRMEHAVELLRKTDYPIAQVAEYVGYSSVKYFCRLCKKTLGMKPSEYRKLYS
ncbi:MAG: response regulator [Lachnospiraceae bacterium]|nr:response regulator [Lachnospiraceae bacterium]